MLLRDLKERGLMTLTLLAKPPLGKECTKSPGLTQDACGCDCLSCLFEQPVAPDLAREESIERKGKPGKSK